MNKVYYQDSLVTIYHGDTRQVLPTLHLSSTDFVLTDPPYGIGYSASRMSYNNSLKFPLIVGDDSTELAAWLLELFPSVNVPNTPLMLIWGANNFPQLLPHKGVWVCWDKRVTENADKIYGWPFELGWLNKSTGQGKMFRVQHGGAVNADGAGVRREHPTQKPAALSVKVINSFRGKYTRIIDPFMGSGTTLKAAASLGIPSIGVEISEEYCQIASKWFT